MKKTATMLRPFLGAALIFISIFLCSCGGSRRAIGVEEGWDLLAQNKVDFVRDKDEIRVDNSTQYTALRFRVEDHDVHISELKIYYRNGDKLEPNIDETVTANQYSRVIELDRDGRALDRIEFKYRTTGSLLKGRANVLLFGKKYRSGY